MEGDRLICGGELAWASDSSDDGEESDEVRFVMDWPAIQRSRTLKNALDNSSVG